MARRMRAARWIRLVAAACVSAGLVLTAPAGGPGGGVRLMPLGDSITDGGNVPGGYRIELWDRLVAGHHPVDFVGSQYNGPAALGDHDHEGHPGWRIDQIDARVVGWLRAYTPRTVLLHIGTNDVVQDYDLAGAPGRLSRLIDRITATLPGVDLFVASIIPLANPALEARAEAYNAAIPGIVAAEDARGAHVTYVDLHAALSTSDLADGVHPTRTGYAAMGDRWYAALVSQPGSLAGTAAPAAPPVPGPGPARSRLG